MRYRTIDLRMWRDAKFRRLSRPQPNAQTLWIALLTGPFTTNIPGVVVAGPAALAESLGWSVEPFMERFRELSEAGMAIADWEAGLVWLPNACRYNQPANPNAVKGWAKTWDEVPESKLQATIIKALRASLRGREEGFMEAFRERFREPCANQEQEQEQEQDPPSGVQDQDPEQDQDRPFHTHTAEPARDARARETPDESGRRDIHHEADVAGRVCEDDPEDRPPPEDRSPPEPDPGPKAVRIEPGTFGDVEDDPAPEDCRAFEERHASRPRVVEPEILGTGAAVGDLAELREQIREVVLAGFLATHGREHPPWSGLMDHEMAVITPTVDEAHRALEAANELYFQRRPAWVWKDRDAKPFRSFVCLFRKGRIGAGEAIAAGSKGAGGSAMAKLAAKNAARSKSTKAGAA